jgi:hypothetical protein
MPSGSSGSQATYPVVEKEKPRTMPPPDPPNVARAITMPRPTPPPQTRGAGAPRRLAILLLSLLALAALAPTPARAKVETGTLKLDSVTTEQTIAKFGTGNDGPGELVLKLTTAKRGWERGTHQLRLMLFKNRKYAKWKAAIAKGSLCDVRNRLADVTKVVDLPHPLATHSGHGFEYFEDPETGRSYRVNKDNPEDVEWRDPNNHTEGPLDRVIHRETEARSMSSHWSPYDRVRVVNADP